MKQSQGSVPWRRLTSSEKLPHSLQAISLFNTLQKHQWSVFQQRSQQPVKKSTAFGLFSCLLHQWKFFIKMIPDVGQITCIVAVHCNDVLLQAPEPISEATKFLLSVLRLEVLWFGQNLVPFGSVFSTMLHGSARSARKCTYSLRSCICCCCCRFGSLHQTKSNLFTCQSICNTSCRTRSCTHCWILESRPRFTELQKWLKSLRNKGLRNQPGISEPSPTLPDHQAPATIKNSFDPQKPRTSALFTKHVCYM